MTITPERHAPGPVEIPRSVDGLVRFMVKVAMISFGRRHYHREPVAVLVPLKDWEEARAAVMQSRFDAAPEVREMVARGMRQPTETGQIH